MTYARLGGTDRQEHGLTAMSTGVLPTTDVTQVLFTADEPQFDAPGAGERALVRAVRIALAIYLAPLLVLLGIITCLADLACRCLRAAGRTNPAGVASPRESPRPPRQHAASRP